jgi:hypothetical protein
MTQSEQERVRINQQNARNSTGPKTPEGKARSRMNALKHGMCAKVLALPNEDPAELAAREQAFFDHYQPQNPRDAFLVHAAALATVQFDRCNRFETAEIGHQVRARFMERETERDETIERFRIAIKTDGELAIHGLRRSAQGCFYLIHQWSKLRKALKTHGFWSLSDWQRAKELDDEFPPSSRVLIGAQDPSDHEQERAFVLAWIEAMITELLDREEAWRAIEDADRAAMTERALMIADAGLAARVLRYRNSSLWTFFRSTNALEKTRNEHGAEASEAVSRNEATLGEESPQVTEEEVSCGDPPPSEPAPVSPAKPAAPAPLDERIAVVRQVYHCDSNVATRKYTQTPQFNAVPIRNY